LSGQDKSINANGCVQSNRQVSGGSSSGGGCGGGGGKSLLNILGRQLNFYFSK
jgi:hypothetical protein